MGQQGQDLTTIWRELESLIEGMGPLLHRICLSNDENQQEAFTEALRLREWGWCMAAYVGAGRMALNPPAPAHKRSDARTAGRSWASA